MRRIMLLVASVMFGFCVASTAQTFPQVVAQVSLTGQNLPIHHGVLYTPSSEGVFRATMSMLMTKPVNHSVFWDGFIEWTDEIGRSESFLMWSLFVSSTPPQASSSGTYTFKAEASKPIYYDVAFGDEHSQYSLYVTLEQLQ